MCRIWRRFPVVGRSLRFLPAEHSADKSVWLFGGLSLQCFNETTLYRHDPDCTGLGLYDGVQWTPGQGLHRSAIPAVD